jgi:hypothetical protein
MFQKIYNGVLGAQFGVFLPFATKVPNICNSCMSVTPKVRVYLGIIGFHPLHFHPFVRVCFTPKHTFDFMGPCTSHLIANPMLRLQHMEWIKEQFSHKKNRANYRSCGCGGCQGWVHIELHPHLQQEIPSYDVWLKLHVKTQLATWTRVDENVV